MTRSYIELDFYTGVKVSNNFYVGMYLTAAANMNSVIGMAVRIIRKRDPGQGSQDIKHMSDEVVAKRKGEAK